MANITWTTEQVEFLTREYYNYTKEELAKMLGKSKAAVVTKHNKMLKGERTTGNKKTRVYLTRCLECKGKVNEVESGYYCLECFAEFDKYGNRLAPIYMDGI